MPTIAPNISVSISGNPKSGKTHFALTFPSPILVLSLDRGLARVVPHFKDVPITPLHFMPPIIDAVNPKPFAISLVESMKKQYEEKVNTGTFKTAVLDTGTILWELVMSWNREHIDKNRPKARDYGDANALISWFIELPIYMGMNTVTIHHLKDEYSGDEPTGNKVLDGFRRTNSLVDIVLRSEYNTDAKKMVKTIESCGFDPYLAGTKLTEPHDTYKDLMLLLGVEVK